MASMIREQQLCNQGGVGHIDTGYTKGLGHTKEERHSNATEAGCTRNKK